MQTLVTLLSSHVWFAVAEPGLKMAHSRMGAFRMASAGAAVLGCHSVPVEAISTPFTVGAVCVPQALQALPGDRVTVTSLRGVHVAAAVTGNTRFARHCWVSIVTICTSLTPSS